jgi:DNA-binding XRE family transcriptional regulator
VSKAEEIAERQEKAKALREEGMTQREIAGELGVSRPTVAADLMSEKSVRTPKPDKEPRQRTHYEITQYTKPETAAKRIREVFGNEFADALVAAMTAHPIFRANGSGCKTRPAAITPPGALATVDWTSRRSANRQASSAFTASTSRRWPSTSSATGRTGRALSGGVPLAFLPFTISSPRL